MSGRASSAKRDLGIAVLAALGIFLLSAYVDAYEAWDAWAHAHERWELDELPLAIAFATFAFAWYAYRRWREFQREFRLRAAANELLAGEIATCKTTETELRSTKARLLGILEIASDAVISIDDGFRITLFNQGAEKTFGYAADEAIGQPLGILVPPRFRDGHEQHLEGFSRAGQASRMMNLRGEIAGLRKDGTEFPAEASISRLDLGGEVSLTVMLRDITRRKRADSEVLAAKEEAEFASRAKSDFLANMSHELRTPLNAVIGFSETMKNETFGPVGSPRYREYAGDINDAARHLHSLINDILDLSKVEAGADGLYEEHVDITRCARAVERLVKERATKRGVVLELAVDQDIPGLRADERKLKQILTNLLTNAIKFTERGGRVTLRAWCRLESGCVIQIVDTGIGIALEDIPKVLSQFGQVDSPLNRKHQGTGLGLPLTKALVELHGGSMDLQSALGQGTTVTLRFPAERIVRRTPNARLSHLNAG
jgi:PAS domain S-box-containing protein